MNEDLVLVPEVIARRALRGRRVRLQMVVPPGFWVGRGRLRVLRVIPRETCDGALEPEVELMVGYEAYET